MILWTRDDETDRWRSWPDALRGLAGLPESWAGAVLLVSDAPDDELPRLLATVQLVRRLFDRATLIAGSPHPANTWMAPLHAAGVDHFWRVKGHGPNGAGARDAGAAVARAEALSAPVCPALHTRSADGVTVSVCGVRGDRLVLPRRQLERHCLCASASCPRWSGRSAAACSDH